MTSHRVPDWLSVLWRNMIGWLACEKPFTYKRSEEMSLEWLSWIPHTLLSFVSNEIPHHNRNTPTYISRATNQIAAFWIGTRVSVGMRHDTLSFLQVDLTGSFNKRFTRISKTTPNIKDCVQNTTNPAISLVAYNFIPILISPPAGPQ